MIKITAADGHKIPIKSVLKGSKYLVVMSHGITTGKDEDGIYSEFAEQHLAPFFDSIRFDFRGHGESTIPSDQVTVTGELLDFMAVMKWAQESGYRKIFHLGTSFGASITLLAISRFSFKFLSAVVFWNPVISYHNTFIQPKVEWAREFFNHRSIEELAFRTGTKVTDTNFVIGPEMTMEMLLLSPNATTWPSNLPLLIVHGDADTCVPFSDAENYAKRFPESTTLLRVQNVDHGFDDKIHDVFKETIKWLKSQV